MTVQASEAPLSRYVRPASTEEALDLLATGNWRILAGGTDFFPAQGNRPIRDDILDINGLEELVDLHHRDDHLFIGARATWSQILRAELPPAFDALKLAAREVGSVQIQNRGTIAGNLCNASPAADGVPPLLALDAEVELASLAGRRILPLDAFLLGSRQTARQPGELLTGLRIPTTSTTGVSHFLKLGARSYLIISIAMVAVRVAVGQDGRIEEVAVAVGACSAVAQRLRRLETALIGRRVGDDALAAVADWPFDELTPIDDVRATAGYRRKAAAELVRRALRQAHEQMVRDPSLEGRVAA
ncbi:xanthine dehydrogenase family protein subunit M [Chelativorans sp. ZYF759]|uniref:FAD binding domain-containing protein n=1 Tax=Chelativorans sp. ZYF759 TaxID=2692213 RepID=UPI001FF05A9C|nr:xanthine dehydrogenase family protein subunit M [Chelativorans sp. ZYF759]